ncbi:MAG: hypothetical protein R3A11_08240 [Bdellovibrionota bacterium]
MKKNRVVMGFALSVMASWSCFAQEYPCSGKKTDIINQDSLQPSLDVNAGKVNIQLVSKKENQICSIQINSEDHTLWVGVMDEKAQGPSDAYLGKDMTRGQAFTNSLLTTFCEVEIPTFRCGASCLEPTHFLQEIYESILEEPSQAVALVCNLNEWIEDYTTQR